MFLIFNKYPTYYFFNFKTTQSCFKLINSISMSSDDDEFADSVTRCICGDNADQEGFMLCCEKCEVWQHGMYVLNCVHSLSLSLFLSLFLFLSLSVSVTLVNFSLSYVF